MKFREQMMDIMAMRAVGEVVESESAQSPF